MHNSTVKKQQQSLSHGFHFLGTHPCTPCLCWHMEIPEVYKSAFFFFCKNRKIILFNYHFHVGVNYSSHPCISTIGRRRKHIIFHTDERKRREPVCTNHLNKIDEDSIQSCYKMGLSGHFGCSLSYLCSSDKDAETIQRFFSSPCSEPSIRNKRHLK